MFLIGGWTVHIKTNDVDDSLSTISMAHSHFWFFFPFFFVTGHEGILFYDNIISSAKNVISMQKFSGITYNSQFHNINIFSIFLFEL